MKHHDNAAGPLVLRKDELPNDGHGLGPLAKDDKMVPDFEDTSTRPRFEDALRYRSEDRRDEERGQQHADNCGGDAKEPREPMFPDFGVGPGIRDESPDDPGRPQHRRGRVPQQEKVPASNSE